VKDIRRAAQERFEGRAGEARTPEAVA
jgi:hypothetical protein